MFIFDKNKLVNFPRSKQRMTSRQLLFALLGVFTIIEQIFSQDQDGFISLDCGLFADEPPYIDSSNKLKYSSNANFVEGGKSGTIQQHLEADYFKAYTTLRYFPIGKRNCYNLNITQGTRYLVTAGFVYGNYDGLDTHPKFDLYIGRSWWATITDRVDNKWASMQSRNRGYGKSEEIIHITWSNTLQVCLVKTGATLPFISALELRPLSNNVYATEDYSPKTFARVYFNNTGTSVRYPDDVHDRSWVSLFPNGMTIISNKTVNIENSNHYDLPLAAIRTAAILSNASSPLIMSWNTSNSADWFYIFIHFLEIEDLRANETRIFDIVLNGVITSVAYRPSSSMVDTVYNRVPFTCNGTVCSLELRKTPASTLPPIINAIEIFKAHEILETATYEDDEIAFETILADYELSTDLIDPCVPKASRYLKCTNNTDTSVPLRIISLILSSNGLSGVISPTIQNLTNLQVLDLSHNKLTGGLPDFLSNMTSLLFIDLSYNSLSGPVPQALLDRKKAGLVLKFQGNPKLNVKTSSTKTLLVVVIASAASVVIVLLVLAVLFIGLQKKWSSREALRPAIETTKRRFTYSEIRGMTNNFQKIVGEGGFGIIYHGYLNDVEQVAVKVLSESSSQGYKQFKAEVELLMRVHHNNLVNLAGYCDERNHLALVYEFMENRDLKEHLSGKEGSSFLDWPSRLRIAAEAALGLEYLHTGCKPPMIHRDVKSTNILLNGDFQAKLGDFGLSRSFPDGSETHVSTNVVGTPGFLDPEYFQTNSSLIKPAKSLI